MKIKSGIYAVLLSGLLLTLLLNCKKEAIKTAPTATISEATNITATSASSGGEITADGGATITARGVCWSTNQSPTTSDGKTSNGSGTGSFSSSITGLTPGATYNIKAYATNSVGTGYSSQSTFITLALAPILSTTDLSSVTSTTANSGGNITNDGGSAVTARGVCWSTSQNPTIADSKISSGTGSGSFTSAITGLTPGATYYVRAYATNSIGTGYGNQVTATVTAILPVLTTTSISALTSTTATSGGNITSDGGSVVTARGVCWSTSANPTTASSKATDGTGSGSFTSSIAGLMPVTTYYVRAYATNNIGTAYGNQMTTTTTAALPSIITTAVSSITTTTATSGGNIASDGGSTVTARGVCWSWSTQTPTTDNNKTTDGTGIGIFASSITGLSPSATYYIRAYATNSIGTTYGNQVTAITIAALPVIITTVVSEITSITAKSGGNITSDGGATITAHGICWSTSQNPTITDAKTANGTGTGSFISSLTGLTLNTTYYVRAYATNSAGTSYGNTMLFTTRGITVTDRDGNVYNTVTIGTQVWMVENLTTTRFSNGDQIPNVTSFSDFSPPTWRSLTTAAYCNYNNNSDFCGRLYNWYAVSDSRKICPSGWHVPSDNEWTILTTYLGGLSIAGGKLKETGTYNWNYPNTEATNETGFTALPGGKRGSDGIFYYIGERGYWWSSSQHFTYVSIYYMFNDRASVLNADGDKSSGFSVRCIKD